MASLAISTKCGMGCPSYNIQIRETNEKNQIGKEALKLTI